MSSSVLEKSEISGQVRRCCGFQEFNLKTRNNHFLCCALSVRTQMHRGGFRFLFSSAFSEVLVEWVLSVREEHSNGMQVETQLENYKFQDTK